MDGGENLVGLGGGGRTTYLEDLRATKETPVDMQRWRAEGEHGATLRRCSGERRDEVGMAIQHLFLRLRATPPIWHRERAKRVGRTCTYA